VAFFDSSEELYTYVGGVLRAAGAHPVAGAALAAADVDVVLELREPDAMFTLRMREPVEVCEGHADAAPDIVVTTSADIIDRYFRGEYNLAVGLAAGKVQAVGSVDTLLSLAQMVSPVFPMYRRMVAPKDRVRA